MPLQWGRDSSAAEIWRVLDLDRAGGTASMGPRLFSRGNSGLGAGAALTGVALQWGRDSSAAEMLRCPPKARKSFVSFNGAATLQPRKFAPRGPHRRIGRCFNGAATLQPRKWITRARRPTMPTSFNGAATLQPRKLAGVDPFPCADGFNGAATLQPRKSFARWKSRARCAGFNGAATLQPRK